MSDTVKCPLCGNSAIEPVLDAVTVTAAYDDHKGSIGALIVLRCKIEGHIFFVRKADLEAVVA